MIAEALNRATIQAPSIVMKLESQRFGSLTRRQPEIGEFSTSFFPHHRKLHSPVNSRSGKLGEIEREREPARLRFARWKFQLTPRKTILPAKSGRDATSRLPRQCTKRQLIICRQVNRQTLPKE